MRCKTTQSPKYFHFSTFISIFFLSPAFHFTPMITSPLHLCLGLAPAPCTCCLGAHTPCWWRWLCAKPTLVHCLASIGTPTPSLSTRCTESPSWHQDSALVQLPIAPPMAEMQAWAASCCPHHLFLLTIGGGASSGGRSIHKPLRRRCHPRCMGPVVFWLVVSLVGP